MRENRSQLNTPRELAEAREREKRRDRDRQIYLLIAFHIA